MFCQKRVIPKTTYLFFYGKWWCPPGQVVRDTPVKRLVIRELKRRLRNLFWFVSEDRWRHIDKPRETNKQMYSHGAQQVAFTGFSASRENGFPDVTSSFPNGRDECSYVSQSRPFSEKDESRDFNEPTQ